MTGNEITLVAPQGQMSGMGHSISYYGYVNYTELNILEGARCFAVNRISRQIDMTLYIFLLLLWKI